ncbi:MAG TPA: RNA chaperone Hfq [Terriglobales bacterium]|nr:RNA chaperone Hfq [Terriglobales bacterium]
MAPTFNDTAARRAPEPDLTANRKLIRPSLAEVRDQMARTTPPPAPTTAHLSAGAAGAAPARAPKKPVPPDQTNAESFYFLKQMQSKTDMVIVLRDGERIRGVIEWYDRHCLKVHRTGEPNLLLYKDTIKYMFKAEEEKRN